MPRTLPIGAAAAAAALWLALPALAGTVELRFAPDPARYSDAGGTPVERERSMAAVGGLLRQLATRLPAEAVLDVEFLDIDLAGHLRPTPRGDLRVLRGAGDAPMLALRWSLTQPGQPTASGTERLHTLALDLRPGDATSSDAYRHERRLLEDWFARRFGAPH